MDLADALKQSKLHRSLSSLLHYLKTVKKKVIVISFVCFICGSGSLAILPNYMEVSNPGLPQFFKFRIHFTRMNGIGPAVEIEVGSFDTNQTFGNIPVMKMLRFYIFLKTI